MIISAIVKNDNIEGDHLILISKKEGHLIQEVFNSYCAVNKRKKKAEKMSKEFNESLQIW